ncbi:hypothetical protein D3C81_1174500 [compost metagenome]
MVGFLHQLAARRAGEARQVAIGIFLGCADIEAVQRPPRLGQRRHGVVGNPLHAGLVGNRPGAATGLRAVGGVHRHRRAPAGAMVEGLPRQGPADGAVAQRGHRVREAGIDQGLRADDAARTACAVHDDPRLRVRRQLPHAQHQFRAGQAGGRGNAHSLVFVEAARVHDNHVGLFVDERLHFPRGQRRRMALRLHQLAERLARHVHVAEYLAAGGDPGCQPAVEPRHIRVAQPVQHRRRARRQILARVLPIDHDPRIAARNPPPRFQFELREREVGRPERMLLGVGVFLAHVDQRDLGAVEQRLPHGQAGDGGKHGGNHGRQHGRQSGHGETGSLDRSQGLGRVELE